MKIHRFYNANLTNSDIKSKSFNIKDQAQINQIINVLRLETGDSIILFNGTTSVDYLCKIKDISKSAVKLDITEGIDVAPPSRKINVYMSFIKKDLVEDTVNKLVQMGVTEFTPIITDRTESKNVHINVERINRIVAEAAEQSGRAELMTINSPLRLKDILETHSTSLGNKRSEQSGQDYVFDITGTANVQNIIGGANSGEAVNLYFGPEGGWTNEELETFNRIAIDNSNFHIVKLGDFTMRAETAVIVGVARML